MSDLWEGYVICKAPATMQVTTYNVRASTSSPWVAPSLGELRLY